MKRRCSNSYLKQIAFSMLILLCAVSVQAQTFKQGARSGMVKVKFKPTMTTRLSQLQLTTTSGLVQTGMSGFDAVAQKHKASDMYRLFPFDARHEHKLRKHGLHLWYVVHVDEKTNPTLVAEHFQQLEEVALAEVDHEKVLAPFSVQPYSPTPATFNALPFNDPYLKDQWHYDNTGQVGTGDADINLFAAWTKTAGANNIVVSVHDQGVDVNHSDLKANIWANTVELNGVVGVDDDGNGYIDDINGYNFEKNKGAVDPQFHGTHVAGTIAAVNNNGRGVSGVAGGSGKGDGVKIMSLQILGGAPIEKSYVYAANNGAVISQNSWGYTSPDYSDQAVLDAIDYFIAEAGDFPGSPMKGGIVIFAAGNSNHDGAWYPGYHPSIMAVSSFGTDWKKATYSNFGEWVDIAAPGGEQFFGSKGGVLSTIPNEQYAYLQGTSMACPHVSGVAALALANRTQQLTNRQLWNKLITGVVSIDAYNENYIGKLGSGAIDATLAIQNDLLLPPAAITQLAVTGMAQEFATLSWVVPSDEDDERPLTFQLYYHSQPLASANLASASKVTIKNTGAAGSQVVYELDGLLGLTQYYFAITSTDRWGNVSPLSNIVTATTNQGPSISVDAASESIELTVDVTSSTSASHPITIQNGASGILRWNYFLRHTGTTATFDASGLRYPVASKMMKHDDIHISKRSTTGYQQALRSREPIASSFQSVEKTYASWPTDIIGETDLTLTNSAAARFYVNEPEGFNLTDVRMYLKHDPALGPVIVEVYQGLDPIRKNLILAQEYSNWSTQDQTAYINLNEQLYFESGSTFWIVFHVPAGNLFPLGMGFEDEPSFSQNCFMSFDLGAHWAPLEEAINSEDFAWTVTAASYNPYLGEYVTLSPGSGDVEANGEMVTTLTAEAASLINGTYHANVVIASNDANNRELRIPVTLNVEGHQPNIRHIDIADFGSVFLGDKKTIDLVLENTGLGNFENAEFSFSDAPFSSEGWAPAQIGAQEEVIIPVTFAPLTAGNINGLLTFTNGTQTYQISLFGVGAETSRLSITPLSQTIDNLAIGDEVTGQVTIENTGAYPLKYFIPGYDEKQVGENWPSRYHRYGYKFRSNDLSEADPLAYDFQNISGTGVNITQQLKDDANYVAIDMGFDFPYYGQAMQQIYIAQKGFTTFDNSVRPINTPSLDNPYNPKGFISVLGGSFDFVSQGQIFYQLEADRLIVQYDQVWDGVNEAFITAQMVLHFNGDIRFYYENMGYAVENQGSLNILIENLEQTDGILVHNYEHPRALSNQLALGFDYPGPNILTAVENGSGILAPGISATVTITMSTASLTEGVTKRYVNIISNDPQNRQASALFELGITTGGTPIPVVSTEAIGFGDVFQGGQRSIPLTIKNEGTANVSIASVAITGSTFLLTGDAPTIIKPGLYKKYEVAINTTTLGSWTDELTITYADNSTVVIPVSGAVVDAPAINIDLTPIVETMAFGDSKSVPFNIENTGLAPLEARVIGQQWLTYDIMDASSAAENSYAFQQYNDGSNYQWLEIRESGTHLPMAENISDKASYWTTLQLPFAFNYYGTTHTELKVGVNGIVSFEQDPDVLLFPDHLPTTLASGAFIMPYWSFSAFNTSIFPESEVGIFHQSDDEKFVITWSYLINNFGGMGDPVSAQLILYKNGTMKFQYRPEEGGQDLTSQFTAIGLQLNSSSGISISDQQRVDHGAGLSYVLVPMDTYVIAPATTLTGALTFNTSNLYGGVYVQDVVIETNVPGSERLVRPVELTVTGEGQVVVPATIDVGSVMVRSEGGLPVPTYKELTVGNNGAAAFDLTWAQMADGTQALSWQIWALVDGWFGPEWRWADVSELYSPWAWQTPTYNIKPGDKLKARVVFLPEAAGTFADELVLATSLGEKRIAITASAYEPAVLNIDESPIEVTMKLESDLAVRSIALDNLEGKSDLQYEVAIHYGRISDSHSEPSQVMAATAVPPVLLSHPAPSGPVAKTLGAYRRTVAHTLRDSPDSHAGMGGGAPFTIATRYTADAEGFNISTVEAWFRTEALTEGKVEIEVRAGGDNIANAVVIGKGVLMFTGSGDDMTGSWHAVALDQPASIYPNEDFYVLVTYPMGIERPQGVVNDEAMVANRYFYEFEGDWYDTQQAPGFETSGWLMLAAETEASNTAWLKVTSAPNSQLAAGESSTIELSMDGSAARAGDQVAEVVVKSNDPNRPEVKVPVTLHRNEAPVFVNVPAHVVVAENEVMLVNIEVEDAEGDQITIESGAAEGINFQFAEGTLSITLKPAFHTAGDYEYAFVATDENGAATEMMLKVEVTHTNQAPYYSGISMPFQNLRKGIYTEQQLTNYFSDPDGDDLTFTVESSDPAKLAVYATADRFIIQPLSYDGATITLSVHDGKGGTVEQAFLVSVMPNTSPVIASPIEKKSFLLREGSLLVSVQSLFSDPEGDALALSALALNETLATVSLSSSLLRIDALMAGDVAIQLRATDPDGLSIDFNLEVEIIGNRAPVVAKPLADVSTFIKDAPTLLVLSDVFTDADGDALTLAVESSNPEKAEVSLLGTVVTLLPKGVGSSVITVTATDSQGASVRAEFQVAVAAILGDLVEPVAIRYVVYPNPTQDMLHVQTAEPTSGIGYVRETTGRLLHQFTITPHEQEYSMDLSGWAPGVYLVEIVTSGEKSVWKIIKN